jgi:ubiquinone/menaquinone biosynthesis C-methylase UbiE
MSLNERFFARIYDRAMARTEKAGLAAKRKALLESAKGDVLEVGAGTGANLAHYGSGVRTLTLTEPAPPMLRQLEKRASDVTADTLAPAVLRAPAEDLPFPDDSFDTVVSTLTLCTVDDQPRALREIRRVLRPGGRLLFLEHVRSDDPRQARWQDRLHGFNHYVGAGCNCNRPTLDTVRSTGFTVTELDHGELDKAPPWVRPLIIGTATA